MKAILIPKNSPIKNYFNRQSQYDYGSGTMLKIETSDVMGSFYYFNVAGNCKVCVLSNIQHIFSGSGDKEKAGVARIKELFTNNVNKLIFSTTFTDMSYVNKCAKHFKLVYCYEVPIGYGNGMQYHCSFLLGTHYPDKPRYEKRILDTLKPKKILNKDNGSLPEISLEQFRKLKNYRRRDHAMKYMLKLINGENL